MLLSSPDPLNSSLMCTEIIDIDLLEDDNCAICGEYTRDIFSYLKEAEVEYVSYLSSVFYLSCTE